MPGQLPDQIPDHYDIIGEHRTASCRFLVVDEAGQRYTWDVERRQLTPITVVSMEEWRLDVDRDRVAARVPDGSR
jgi:hypothetical protein